MTQSSTANQTSSLSTVVETLLRADILSAMGLESLDNAEQQSLYRTMIATVQDRVIAHVLDELTPTEREQLGRLMQGTDDQAVEQWLAERVSTIDEIVNEEAFRYKAEMIQNAQHVRAVLGLSDPTEDQAKNGADTANQPNLPATVAPAAPPAVYHPDEL